MIIQKYTDLELDKEVLFVLKQHLGKKNPVGRWEIVSRVFGAGAAALQNDDNPADRQIRESIARLRKGGVLVCNMGDGRGSYLAESVEEYNEFRSYYGSAAFEKMEIIRRMDDAAKSEFPDLLQPRLI